MPPDCMLFVMTVPSQYERNSSWFLSPEASVNASHDPDTKRVTTMKGTRPGHERRSALNWWLTSIHPVTPPVIPPPLTGCTEPGDFHNSKPDKC